MEYLMWSAAALTGVTTCIHLFAGTKEIMTPILKAEHPVALKAVMMVIWHGVTLILALMTIGIAFVAMHQNIPLALFIIAVQLGFAGLFLYYNLSMIGGLFRLPQWTVFLLVPALMSLALFNAG